MNKAVFLDRDGVINEDMGYIYKSEDFHFMSGIFDFCHAAQTKGYLLIIITNQSGIARGFYTVDDYKRLDGWMLEKFREKDIHICKTYYCPFHPREGIGVYKKDSFDRKPKPGMFVKAQAEFNIDMRDSIAIGDRDSDMEAGRRAEVGRLLIVQGKNKCTKADDVVVLFDVSEAVAFL